MENFTKLFTKDIFQRTKEWLDSKNSSDSEQLNQVKESKFQGEQAYHDKVRMENFETPFVPETNEPTVEAIEINENMNQFSNHDLEAALLLIQDGQKKFQHRNLTGERSRFFSQAKKAVEFLNVERKKYGLNKLSEAVRKDKNFPFPETLETGWFVDSIYRSGLKNNVEIPIEDSPHSTISYEHITFEKYLAILNWQKDYFSNNTKMRNALGTVINYVQEQETLHQTSNKIRKELEQRPSEPSIQNVNGKAEEHKDYYESNLTNFVDGIRTYLYHLESEHTSKYQEFYQNKFSPQQATGY
jgi:hypothetical protein